MDVDLKEQPEKGFQSVKAGGMMAGLGENITIQMRAEVDGEEVLNQEGDSLTWGFVHTLLRQMRGYSDDTPRVYLTSDGDSDVFLTGTDNSNTNFRFEWKTRDLIEDNSYYEWDRGNTSQDFIYLTGHPEIENRPFYIADHSNFHNEEGWIEVNEAEWDPSTRQWVDTGNAFAPSDASTFSLYGGEKANRIWSTDTISWRSHYNAFNGVDLHVGAGRDAMSLSNVGAARYNRANFSYDSQGRPAPVINTNDANLKWSRTVTNDTGEAVDITELFLQKDKNGPLIAKDAITAVTIPTGSSATFYYQIEVDNSGDGGVMAQFLELFYRHSGSSRRECPDIFNDNKNRRRSYWTFRAALGAPGQSPEPAGKRTDIPRNLGLMVGTGTGEVANTNFALDNRILHGDNSGELHHHGSFITDYIVDETNDRLYFEMERVFENRTGSSITINEVGIYVGGAEYEDDINYAALTGGSYEDELPDFHLITRSVLSTSITISAGNIKKLYYEIGVQI